MPVIRQKVAATTTDALNGLKFKVQNRPALLTLGIAGATAGDSFSFAVGSSEIIAAGTPMNLESANEVVDMERDLMMVQERVPPGEYFMPCTVTADCSFVLIIEPT